MKRKNNKAVCLTFGFFLLVTGCIIGNDALNLIGCSLILAGLLFL